MSNSATGVGAEAATRESTLQAVQQDQGQMQDQLRDLTQIITRIEEWLLGGPHVQMMSAAQAQQEGLVTGPAPQGLLHPNPPPSGILPQMCEMGRLNSAAVSDIYSRLQQISRLLGIHDG